MVGCTPTNNEGNMLEIDDDVVTLLGLKPCGSCEKLLTQEARRKEDLEAIFDVLYEIAQMKHFKNAGPSKSSQKRQVAETFIEELQYKGFTIKGFE